MRNTREELQKAHHEGQAAPTQEEERDLVKSSYSQLKQQMQYVNSLVAQEQLGKGENDQKHSQGGAKHGSRQPNTAQQASRVAHYNLAKDDAGPKNSPQVVQAKTAKQSTREGSRRHADPGGHPHKIISQSQIQPSKASQHQRQSYKMFNANEIQLINVSKNSQQRQSLQVNDKKTTSS